MRVLALLFLSAILFTMNSCETTVIEAEDSGFAYFPLEPGRYIVYEVDSIYHDLPVGVQDTFHFYIKEVVDTTFLDLEDRPSNRIERFYKDSLSHPWELKNVWVANRTNQSAQRVEENLRYVRMVFPVTDNVTWDGNTFNILDAWEHHYEDIDIPKQIGGTNFQKTVTVIQRDRVNLLEEEFAQEIYSYDLGLVYKQLDSLKFTFSGGISEIESGVEFRMTAIETGFE